MTDAPEGFDQRDNDESRAYDRDQSSYVGRAAGNGTGPEGVELSEETEAATGGGVAGGNPVAGVTIDGDDLEHAVPGDTGPEHPGQR